LVGRDSLSEDQKLTLEIAKIIREEFLQQNAFSDWDYMCPLQKTVGMMKCIVHYHDCALKAIKESAGEHKISWAIIYNQTKTIFDELNNMKFKSPKSDPKEFTDYFNKIVNDTSAAF